MNFSLMYSIVSAVTVVQPLSKVISVFSTTFRVYEKMCCYLGLSGSVLSKQVIELQ